MYLCARYRFAGRQSVAQSSTIFHRFPEKAVATKARRVALRTYLRKIIAKFSHFRKVPYETLALKPAPYAS